MRALARLALLAVALGGCRPDFGAALSLVTAPRLVAVRGEPAEAAPGTGVMFSVLVASPDGTVPNPDLAWSVCLQPKPTTENDVVDPACLAPGGTTPIAAGSLTVPSDSCRLFGPDLPPQTAGQPPLQPRAPDATGGYYQPIRLDLDGRSTIALERIRCALAGASMDLATEFQSRYTPNQNPTLTPLSAEVNGAAVPLDQIPAGAKMTLTVGWTPDSPETYPVLDALDQTLIDHREAMSVAWYATAGALADERSGRAEDDPALAVDNTFTAPAAPGPVHLWVVLRDSRGGVDFAGYDLVVR